MLLLFLTAALSGKAASVTLGWDPSPDPEVIGYNVYYGPNSHTYTNVVDAGDNTVSTVYGLVIGQTYYFAVTAYNSLDFESPPTDEIVYTVPNAVYRPKIAANSLNMTNGEFAFTIGFDPGQTVIFQTSTDLVNWVAISTNLLPTSALRITNAPATDLIRVFRALVQ